MPFYNILSLLWLSLLPNFLLASASSKAVKIVAATINIPIDHFNSSDTRTYQNRYWMNDTWYETGGPVFVYDGGEQGLDNSQAQQLLGGAFLEFAPLQLARRYHGIAIMWEHRFYGESMPFEFNETTGVAFAGYDAYKYLDNDQALEDVAYLTKHFQPLGYENRSSLSSESTPWIWYGSSYAGTRAARLRVRNPDAIFASWASSAVVQAQVDASVYFNPIIQNMPSNCSADVHAAINYADRILLEGSAEEVLILKRAVFLTNAANPRNISSVNTPEDLTYWDISQILAYAFQSSVVSYQNFGYERSLAPLCNSLETWNPANFPGFNLSSPASVLINNTSDSNSTATGIAAHYGPSNAFYAFLFATYEKSKADFSFIPGSLYRNPQDQASWIWQLCSQFAQFQVAAPHNPYNIISRFDNITSTLDNFCHKLHPYAPDRPQVNQVLKYGGWDMKPSNVMFTNGALDPWRTLGIQADTSINPKAPNRPTTRVVPPCNIPPPGNAVFGVVYPGQVHGSDGVKAISDPRPGLPIDVGLELFSEALNVWLKCYRKGDEDGKGERAGL